MVRIGESNAGSALYLSPSQIANAESIEQIAPRWQPGDVVVVTFAKGTRAPSYTYVRGEFRFVGERSNGLTDAEITRLFSEGRVRHVLRDGHPVNSATAPF
jgi:hypothetical protein